MNDSKFLKNTFYLTCLVFVLKLIAICFHPFHYPSEARYAAISMRMVLTQNYLMPFFDPITPFFGKPPLSFWASAFSLQIFGFNEFAARLPHFLALLLSCLIIYQTVKKIFDEKTAMIAVVVISSSLLFLVIHSVMTEAFLLLGMTMISTSFLLVMNKEKNDKKNYDLLFFLGCVISMLTKGPVGIVMPCLSIPFYLSYNQEWKKFFQKFPLIYGGIFFILAAFPWFFFAEKNYPGFLKYFFLGENLGRFIESGWQGDRYGKAHHVMFGMIWVFFIATTLPIISALFIKPKTIAKTFIYELKNDRDFQFFFLSFLLPMILLTFMRNMIGTYPVYVLTPFSILMARILAKIKWEKFVYFLSYLTISIYLIAIAILAFLPAEIHQKINYQSYLLDQIPTKNYQIYYLDDKRKIFTIYWQTKDKVKILDKNSFDLIDVTNPTPIYVLSDSDIYDRLSKTQKSKLKNLACTKNNRACLYEFIR